MILGKLPNHQNNRHNEDDHPDYNKPSLGCLDPTFFFLDLRFLSFGDDL